MLEEIIEKTTLEDAGIILISAIAIVSFWRGMWGLMDLYLIPENNVLSLVVSVIFGLLVLILITLYKGQREDKK